MQQMIQLLAGGSSQVCNSQLHAAGLLGDTCRVELELVLIPPHSRDAADFSWVRCLLLNLQDLVSQSGNFGTPKSGKCFETKSTVHSAAVAVGTGLGPTGC